MISIYRFDEFIFYFKGEIIMFNLIMKADIVTKFAALVAAMLTVVILVFIIGMTIDPFFGLRWLSNLLTQYMSQDSMLSIVITLQVAKYFGLFWLAHRVLIIVRNIKRTVRKK
jgi:hypothetical protein